MDDEPHPWDVERNVMSWRAMYEEVRAWGNAWKQRAEERDEQNTRLRAALVDLASFVREFADADDVADIIPLETAERLLGRRPC